MAMKGRGSIQDGSQASTPLQRQRAIHAFRNQIMKRSKLEGLRKVVMKITTPVYVARDGSIQRVYNTLTEERELELRNHLDGCDIALQMCPDCWLLYVSIGQDEYVKALTGNMEDYN